MLWGSGFPSMSRAAETLEKDRAATPMSDRRRMIIGVVPELAKKGVERRTSLRLICVFRGPLELL